jgi:hypothetical protein
MSTYLFHGKPRQRDGEGEMASRQVHDFARVSSAKSVRISLMGAVSCALLAGMLISPPSMARAEEQAVATPVAVPEACTPSAQMAAQESTSEPTTEPTPEPTSEPTSEPTPEPTPEPTVQRVWPIESAPGERGDDAPTVAWFVDDDTQASPAQAGVLVDARVNNVDVTSGDRVVDMGAQVQLRVDGVVEPSGVRVAWFDAEDPAQPAVTTVEVPSESGGIDELIDVPVMLSDDTFLLQVSGVTGSSDDPTTWRWEIAIDVVEPAPSTQEPTQSPTPEPTPDPSEEPAPVPVVCAEPVGGVSAVEGMNAASVRWSWADAQFSDSDVTIYIEVSADVAGAGERVVQVPGDSREFTVDGLRNGVEYSFAVHVATGAGSTPPANIASARPSTGVEGEVAGVIVTFAPGSAPGADASGEVPGADVVEQVGLVPGANVSDSAQVVEFTEAVDVATAEAIAAQLTAQPEIVSAEPDMFLFISEDAPELAETVTVPNDPDYAGSQWNLWDSFGIGIGDGERMTEAWAGPRGEGVTVAVIDTGITAHPDLDAQVVAGYDFVSNPEQLASSRQANAPPVPFDGDYVDESSFGGLGRDSNPTDPGDWRLVAPVRDSSWHGTKMAGIIAAAAGNGEGIAGVAPGRRSSRCGRCHGAVAC